MCEFMLKKFQERVLHDEEAFGVKFILDFDLGVTLILTGFEYLSKLEPRLRKEPNRRHKWTNSK